MKLEVDKTKLALAIIASLVALALPLKFVSTSTAIELIMHQGYLAMSATLLVFLVTLWPLLNHLRHKRIQKESLKTHLPGIILILLGIVFLHLHEKPGFKILFDEHVLSSTAKSLHYKQTAYAQSAGHIITEELRPRIGFVDKRPLLFPFSLSLIHNLLGYDVENVFLLNTALTLVLLSLLYLTVARFCGLTHAFLAVLLLLGLPLLAQNTNGGGYELLNLCLIAGLILSGIRYLQHDSPTGGLNPHVMTAVLLANVRYESVLYVLVPAALFLLKSLRTKGIRLTWLSAASPLLLILPLLNYAVFQREPRFIQTTKENFFSLDHLPENFSHAVTYLFDMEGNYTNSALLSFCGVVAIVMILVHVARRPAEHLLKNNTLPVVLVAFAVASTNTLLALTCYWGEWTDPLTSRFSFPFQWFMVLLIPFLLKEHFHCRRAPFWLIALAGIQLVFVTPAHNARMANEPRLANAVGFDWAMRWIVNHQTTGQHLYLCRSATGIGLLEKAALPFMVANTMPERVMMTRELGIYDAIYAVETFVYVPDRGPIHPKNQDTLNPRYQLETVAERWVTGSLIYRISRVNDLSAPTDTNYTQPADLPQTDSIEDINLQDIFDHYRDLIPLVPQSFKSSPSSKQPEQ